MLELDSFPLREDSNQSLRSLSLTIIQQEGREKENLLPLGGLWGRQLPPRASKTQWVTGKHTHISHRHNIVTLPLPGEVWSLSHFLCPPLSHQSEETAGSGVGYGTYCTSGVGYGTYCTSGVGYGTYCTSGVGYGTYCTSCQRS